MSRAAVPVLVPRLQHERADGLPPDACGSLVRQEWRDPRGTLLAYGGLDQGRFWMHWPAAGTFYFSPSDGDVIVHASPGASAGEIEDTFVRGVLPVVFIARGYEALHASAVVLDGRLAAFAAASGTGKSTLAAAVAEARGTQWADDTTLWSVAGGTPVSVALPYPRRLDAPAQAAIGAMTSSPSASGTAARRGIEPGTTVRLAALYLVTRSASSPARVEFSRVAPPAAFRCMLAHAHPFQLTDGRPRQLLERMLALASRLPVFELRFGSGFEHLPSVAQSVAHHAASLGRS